MKRKFARTLSTSNSLFCSILAMTKMIAIAVPTMTFERLTGHLGDLSEWPWSRSTHTTTEQTDGTCRDLKEATWNATRSSPKPLVQSQGILETVSLYNVWCSSVSKHNTICGIEEHSTHNEQLELEHLLFSRTCGSCQCCWHTSFQLRNRVLRQYGKSTIGVAHETESGDGFSVDWHGTVAWPFAESWEHPELDDSIRDVLLRLNNVMNA